MPIVPVTKCRAKADHAAEDTIGRLAQEFPTSPRDALLMAAILENDLQANADSPHVVERNDHAMASKLARWLEAQSTTTAADLKLFSADW